MARRLLGQVELLATLLLVLALAVAYMATVASRPTSISYTHTTTTMATSTASTGMLNVTSYLVGLEKLAKAYYQLAARGERIGQLYPPYYAQPLPGAMPVKAATSTVAVSVPASVGAIQYSTTNIQFTGVREPDYLKVVEAKYVYILGSKQVYKLRVTSSGLLVLTAKRDYYRDALSILPPAKNITISIDGKVVAIIPFKTRITPVGIIAYRDKIIVVAVATRYPSTPPLLGTPPIVTPAPTVTIIPPPYIPVTVWWYQKYTVVLVYDDRLRLRDGFWMEGQLLAAREAKNKLIVVSYQDPLLQPLLRLGPQGLPVLSNSWGVTPRVIVVGYPPRIAAIVAYYDLENGGHSLIELLGPQPRVMIVDSNATTYILATSTVMPIIRLEASINQLEKELKEGRIVRPYPEGLTSIVRVSETGGKLAVRVTVVEGSATGQLAVNIADGVLEVVLQRGYYWRSQGFNLYVLDAKTLKQLANMTKILEGERVRAVRFVGDKLYVVTYRSIDPLFVIDLSNPRKPRIVGFRRGPGFDVYLHPYNKTILIGVGYTDKHRVRVTIYRVEANSSITVVSQETLPAYYTPVTYAREQGYHAFLLDRKHNLILLPVLSLVRIVTQTKTIILTGYTYYAIPFNNKTMKLGRPVPLKTPPAGAPSWARAAYIDDNLYIATGKGVNIYDAKTLKLKTTIKLEG